METPKALTKAQVVELFKAFGGPSKLARAVAVPITTAHTWKRKRIIPSWRLPAVLGAAALQGIEVPQRRAA